ncbi:MAG: TerB family tellurite resistance protein [Thermodesulfobacteriota bacterium]
MGWIGKLVGGAIGFAIGGPLGAIAGATFGHAFDLNEAQLPDVGNVSRLSESEREQLTFFVAAFSMLAKLAQADGSITEKETAAVEHFMTADLNLDPASRNVAVNIFWAAKQSPETFASFAGQFYHQFQYRPQMLSLMIDIMLRVSVADGKLTPLEEKLILEAVRIFHYGQDEYRKLKSRYISDTEKYYGILGCERTDSDDTIKKQYRKLVQDYHPDKIAAKGLPEEFIKFAGDKFREIQEAYEMVKKERGLS